jgi:hypothetical protein
VSATPCCPCNDCGVDCVEIGEYYMASPEVWERQLGLGWHDNLCIGCLEKRLGRRVTFPKDIYYVPSPPCEPSLRLATRLFGHLITKRPPYRLLKSAKNFHCPRAFVKKIGEYRDAEPAADAASPAGDMEA